MSIQVQRKTVSLFTIFFTPNVWEVFPHTNQFLSSQDTDWVSRQKIIYICDGLFLASIFIPLVHMPLFMPWLHYFGYCSFVVIFEIRKFEFQFVSLLS